MLMSILLSSGALAADDSFSWLEEVDGDKSMAWVRERNALSEKALQNTDTFRETKPRLKAIFDSDERIPYVGERHGMFYNFWKDADHKRGLWRRTTPDSYKTEAPEWEVVLDLDALGEAEGENWVWHGAECLGPQNTTCMVALSRGGADADVTDPDAGGDDIIERRDRVWETGPLLARMVATLEVAGRDIPDYLRLLEQQHSEYLGEAFLAQPCFWVGEMEIGQIEGVVVTEAGFMHGHEVTRVLYDQRVLNLETLYEKAARRNVASAVFADSNELRRLGGRAKVDKPGRYRKAPGSDQKRQLGRNAAGNFTESQLTKLNAFTRVRRGDTDRFLLPSQR